MKSSLRKVSGDTWRAKFHDYDRVGPSTFNEPAVISQNRHGGYDLDGVGTHRDPLPTHRLQLEQAGPVQNRHAVSQSALTMDWE